jgi:hypothetical protein
VVVTTSVTVMTSVSSAEDDDELEVGSTVVVTTAVDVITSVSSAEDDETVDELSEEDLLVEVV